MSLPAYYGVVIETIVSSDSAHAGPTATSSSDDAERLECPYTTEERNESWRLCAETMDRHYGELMKRWNAHMDMLLVFAGLFSAALIAFINVSIALLQPDKNDAIIVGLAVISSQLHDLSIEPRAARRKRLPYIPPSYASFFPAPSAVWINLLWFASLFLTLAVAIGAVTVKQWLQRCTQGLTGSSRETARHRQLRYEGLHKWRVPEIIALLPILLLLAFVTFVSGLLIYLWTLHSTVAAVASFLAGLILLFLMLTAVLPNVYVDCVYMSPQAHAIFMLSQMLGRAVRSTLVMVNTQLTRYRTCRCSPRLRMCVVSAQQYVIYATNCMGSWGKWPSWQVREMAQVEVMASHLDYSLAVATYRVTLDNDMLVKCLSHCLWDISPEYCLSFCRQVLRHVNLNLPHLEGYLHVFLSNGFWRVMERVREGGRVEPEVAMGIVNFFETATTSWHSWVAEDPCPRLRSIAYNNYLKCMSQLARMGYQSALRTLIEHLSVYHYGVDDILHLETLRQVISVLPRRQHDLDRLMEGFFEHSDSLRTLPFLVESSTYLLRRVSRHQGDLEGDCAAFDECTVKLLAFMRLILLHPRWYSTLEHLKALGKALGEQSVLRHLTRCCYRHPRIRVLLAGTDLARAFRHVVAKIYSETLEGWREAQEWHAKIADTLETLEALVRNEGDSQTSDQSEQPLTEGQTRTPTVDTHLSPKSDDLRAPTVIASMSLNLPNEGVTDPDRSVTSLSSAPYGMTATSVCLCISCLNKSVSA